MNILEALYSLGAGAETLTSHEKGQLDRDGYLPIREVLSMEQINALRARHHELLIEEGDSAGKEVHQERGTDRLSDLINKGEVFHIVLKQPRVLAAIAHVLEYDLKLSSLNSRNALPGQGLQGLHADWGRLETPGTFQVCNSLWLLDDLTELNGATRLVPGTHRNTSIPSEEMADTSARHPDQLLVLGKAGDVVVVNSHTWHGGTINQTSGPRLVMHGYFCRCAQPQQLDQQKYLRRSTWESLSEEARVVLGVTQRPPTTSN